MTFITSIFLAFLSSLKMSSFVIQGSRTYAHDVVVAILVFRNNEMAAMLVCQTNPLGVQQIFCL